MDTHARITLVRHGETSANVQGVWHGTTDTALNARGRTQAARVALHLARTRPDARVLYASPLARAHDTAAAIGARLGLPVRTHEGLREYHLGAWEGLSFHELGRRHNLFERMEREPDWRPGGGESPRMVGERCGRALAEIAEHNKGARALVVTHGGALALGLGWLLDGADTRIHEPVDNASVSEVRFTPAARLLFLNHTHHLHGV